MGIKYISGNPQITNVLLTGGDPLLMSTRRLVEIIESLRAIPHVRIIWLGSKMPAFDPWRIFQEALRSGSGLARRARFVMSHETGKVEILAMDDQHIYARYHRARHADLRGQFMFYKRDDSAKWLDDLELVSATPASN